MTARHTTPQTTSYATETLTVYGDIVGELALELEQALEQALGRDTHFIILDLSAMTFIDEIGISAIVAAMRTARMNQGDVILLWPVASGARKLLQLYVIDRVFLMCETLWEAHSAIEQHTSKLQQMRQRNAV